MDNQAPSPATVLLMLVTAAFGVALAMYSPVLLPSPRLMLVVFAVGWALLLPEVLWGKVPAVAIAVLFAFSWAWAGYTLQPVRLPALYALGVAFGLAGFLVHPGDGFALVALAGVSPVAAVVIGGVVLALGIAGRVFRREFRFAPAGAVGAACVMLWGSQALLM